MKLTKKLIDSVVSQVVGDDVIPVVDLLKTNKNISEFEISSKIKIPVDVIRNQLYRLYNNNMVSFIRKKDKKKGWYIYYWNVNLERIKYLVTDLKRKRIDKLKESLSREEDTHFFSCINKCIRVDFEQATNFEYRCPECGELLNQENNKERIESIKNEMEELHKEIVDQVTLENPQRTKSATINSKNERPKKKKSKCLKKKEGES